MRARSKLRWNTSCPRTQTRTGRSCIRGGKIAALGLGESQIRAQNPRIIYPSLSAYGARGPDALKPGFDALIQARTFWPIVVDPV